MLTQKIHVDSFAQILGV